MASEAINEEYTGYKGLLIWYYYYSRLGLLDVAGFSRVTGIKAILCHCIVPSNLYNLTESSQNYIRFY